MESKDNRAGILGKLLFSLFIALVMFSHSQNHSSMLESKGCRGLRSLCRAGGTAGCQRRASTVARLRLMQGTWPEPSPPSPGRSISYVLQRSSRRSLAQVSLDNRPDRFCFLSALRPPVPPLHFPLIVGLSYRHGEAVAASKQGEYL